MQVAGGSILTIIFSLVESFKEGRDRLGISTTSKFCLPNPDASIDPDEPTSTAFLLRLRSQRQRFFCFAPFPFDTRLDNKGCAVSSLLSFRNHFGAGFDLFDIRFRFSEIAFPLNWIIDIRPSEAEVRKCHFVPAAEGVMHVLKSTRRRERGVGIVQKFERLSYDSRLS